MPTECPNCERVFKARSCPNCGWSRTKDAPKGPPLYVVPKETRPLHEIYPTPATDEEAKRHIKGILTMLAGSLDAGRPKKTEADNDF